MIPIRHSRSRIDIDEEEMDDEELRVPPPQIQGYCITSPDRDIAPDSLDISTSIILDSGDPPPTKSSSPDLWSSECSTIQRNISLNRFTRGREVQDEA